MPFPTRSAYVIVIMIMVGNLLLLLLIPIIIVHTKHSVTVTLFAASGALHYSYYYELKAPWHDHSCLMAIIIAESRQSIADIGRAVATLAAILLLLLPVVLTLRELIL